VLTVALCRLTAFTGMVETALPVTSEETKNGESMIEDFKKYFKPPR